jgi:hypothetical protein
VTDVSGVYIPPDQEDGNRRDSCEYVAITTLRDYFAAQAMVGAAKWVTTLDVKGNHRVFNVEWYSRVAYQLADAMLEAREK